MALYDALGQGYDRWRAADPSIADLLWRLAGLRPGASCLDMGCGTGNYTLALANKGAAMTGLDPSALMLDTARRKAGQIEWVEGGAEAMPFSNGAFDAIITVNALLHVPDRAAAFAECARVLAPGGRLVCFGNTDDDVRRMWLARYFPEAMERSAQDSLSEADYAALGQGAGLAFEGRVGWTQPPDPVDHFLYCGKRRPELYLDPDIRAGISTFTKYGLDAEIREGLERLQADIQSGAIAPLRDAPDAPTGDYSAFAYRKP